MAASWQKLHGQTVVRHARSWQNLHGRRVSGRNGRSAAGTCHNGPWVQLLPEPREPSALGRCIEETHQPEVIRCAAPRSPPPIARALLLDRRAGGARDPGRWRLPCGRCDVHTEDGESSVIRIDGCSSRRRSPGSRSGRRRFLEHRSTVAHDVTGGRGTWESEILAAVPSIGTRSARRACIRSRARSTRAWSARSWSAVMRRLRGRAGDDRRRAPRPRRPRPPPWSLCRSRSRASQGLGDRCGRGARDGAIATTASRRHD